MTRPAAHYNRVSRKLNNDDPRTPSEKDVDRIIYCSAFSRLAYTTQVFDPTHGARYHNRLTHSLKVAQLARRISAKLIRDDASVADVLDPNVAEAAALAHDLGHPPFGHVGEYIIDELLRSKGIDDGFEGNAQTFRVLTTLAMRTAGSKGLDLTAATLCAVMKYPCPRDKEDNGPKQPPKFGYYGTEQHIARFARAELGLAGRDRSTEAEVMDISDDIAYSVYDLHDFYKSGHIPVNELFSKADYEKKIKYSDRAELFFSDYNETDKSKLKKAFERLCTETLLPILARYDNTEEHRAKARQCASQLIERFISGLSTKAGKLVIAPDIQHEIKLLKKFTWQYVVNSRYLQIYQEGHKRVIRAIFELYDHKVATRSWPFFPPDLVKEKLKDGNPSDRYRAIADLIATKTEQELIEEYKRISGSMLIGMSPL